MSETFNRKTDISLLTLFTSHFNKTYNSGYWCFFIQLKILIMQVIIHLTLRNSHNETNIKLLLSTFLDLCEFSFLIGYASSSFYVLSYASCH